MVELQKKDGSDATATAATTTTADEQDQEHPTSPLPSQAQHEQEKSQRQEDEETEADESTSSAGRKEQAYETTAASSTKDRNEVYSPNRDLDSKQQPPTLQTSAMEENSQSSPRSPTTNSATAAAHAYDELDLNEEIMEPDDPLYLEPFQEQDGPRSPDDRKRRSPPRPTYFYSQPPPLANYRRSPPSHQQQAQRHRYSSNPIYSPGGASSAAAAAAAAATASSKYYAGYSPYYHYHPEHHHPYHMAHHHQQPPPYHMEGYYPPLPPSGPYPEEDGIPAPPLSSSSKKDETPVKSPLFASPNKKMRRSPPFQPSPGAAALFPTGSFGMMDTPSGTLPATDFSPLGAPYANSDFGLDEYHSSNFLDFKDESSASPRRKSPERSPLADFMASPFEMNMHSSMRSPMMSLTAPAATPGADNDNKTNAVTFSHSSANRRMGPLESAAKPAPRKLWPKEDTAPPASSGTPSGTNAGAVRMEIGGAASFSTRNKLAGINSMVQSTPSSRSGGYMIHPPPPPSSVPPPHHYYRSDMTTPIKTAYRGHPPPPHSYRHPYGPGPSSSSKKSRHPASMSASKVPIPPPYMRQSPTDPEMSRKGTPIPMGKENIGGKKKSPGSKRSPCNCKRSKCLKLYCECFAAERFCSGCNCNDCGNTPNAGPARDKAIKETRAKNPNAFKQKFDQATEQQGHNMGCRCRKSECLKKYCECFQAGVICGGKCKCVDCLNYAGSQALIDKRRKIKDQRGAEFAMRVADEAWKGKSPGPVGGGGSARKPTPPPPSDPSRRRSAPSPIGSQRLGPPPHHRMHSTPRGGHPQRHHAPHHHPHPHYMGHPGMMMGPPMGYSPMGMPMTPAGYPPHPDGHGMYPPPPGPPPSGGSRKTVAPMMPKNAAALALSTPKTPAVRKHFDPATSRKKRKLSSGESEPTLPFFGDKLPMQPKTTALAIFAFLSNDDIYNAGLVCKSWSRLAVDEELWKFQS